VPGVSISDPDFEGLRILGAGLTILAFEDMVFKRRAAFSATAIPEALRQGGSFALAVVAAPSRREEAVFDLQRLMRRLALETLEQKDLDDFARVETGREAAGLQGVLALASGLSYREVNGLGVPSVQKGLSSRVVRTPEQVKELAARYLKPESWIVIKVGPASP
jgi:predicted Zn-dependent peptidase